MDTNRIHIMNAKNSVLSTLVAALISQITTTHSEIWTAAPEPIQNWVSVTASADGKNLAAAGNYGKIYTSTNGGLQWNSATKDNVLRPWAQIAGSADGRTLTAVGGPTIWNSGDAGQTWSETVIGGSDWAGVAASADGKRLAIVNHNAGGIMTSSDAGVHWSITAAPLKRWRAIASSADGVRLVAGADVGPNLNDRGSIFVSTNGGLTWVETTAPNNGGWQTIASSADGNRLAAGLYGGKIYTSINGGVTWSASQSPTKYWGSIASSSDGAKLVAAAFNDVVYTSNDGGTTWTGSDTPNAQWQSVATSADGNKMVAAIWGGEIYSSSSSVAPNLTISFAAGNVNLSWPASVTGFTLQQASSPNSSNWSDVNVSPTIVNSQNRVSLSTSSGSGFFRLVAK
jgi:hypothetical protein